MSPSPAPTHFTSHWTPLPGWSPGRTMLACYVTFDDEPAVHAVVDAYQTRLADVAGLDLVPRPWLHMTVQGVWFTDALPPTAHRMLADALGDALAGVPAPSVEIAPPVVGTQGVVLPLRPVSGLARIRNEVRAAVHDALGLADPYVLPGQDRDFDPHITLGYANGAFPISDVVSRLADVEHPPTTTTVRGVALLSVDRSWRWTDAAHVPLAREGKTEAVPAIR